jgi:large subunit ribosomal protein L17
MRHQVSGRKLGRAPSHRRMLYRNLVTALFKHERIQTTVPKAKEARSVAERLITCAKRGDLSARRRAARRLTDPQVLKKLFEEIAPRYAERPGGYTRILRLSGMRKGDGAEIAILELVDTKAKPRVRDTKKRKQRRRELKAEEKAEAAAALQEAAEKAEEAEEAGAAETAGEAEQTETAAAEPASSGQTDAGTAQEAQADEDSRSSD